MKVLVVLCATVAVVMAAKLGNSLVDPTTTTEPPKPYNFGYEVRDANTTNYHNRAEASDAGCVKGSYSYVLPDDFVYTVTYEDCGEGYKAVVRKEPSGINVIIPEQRPRTPVRPLA